MTGPENGRSQGGLRWLTRVTIGVGAFMCVFEIARNWGNWQPWPWWVVDYFCAALLIAGGWWAGRPLPQRSIALMCAAWGFLLALVYGSFVGNLAHLDQPNYGPIPQRPYTMLVGFFLACVSVGFVWCVWVAAGSKRSRP